MNKFFFYKTIELMEVHALKPEKILMDFEGKCMACDSRRLTTCYNPWLCLSLAIGSVDGSPRIGPSEFLHQ